MSDGGFAYVGLLGLSGLVLAVLAVRGFGQNTPARVADAVFGVGFLGYAAYRALESPDWGTDRVYLAVFLVPVLALGHMILALRGARARRSAAGFTTSQPYAQEQLAPTPLTPFPALPPPLTPSGSAAPAAPAPAAVPPSSQPSGFSAPPPPASAQPGSGYHALPTLPAGLPASDREAAPVGAKRPPMPSGLSGAPGMEQVTFQPRPSGLAQSSSGSSPAPSGLLSPAPSGLSSPSPTGLSSPSPSTGSAPARQPESYQPPPSGLSGPPAPSPASYQPQQSGLSGFAPISAPPEQPVAYPPAVPAPPPPAPGGYSDAYWTQPTEQPGVSVGRAQVGGPAGWAAASPDNAGNQMPYAGGRPGSWQQPEPGPAEPSYPAGHHGYAEPPRTDQPAAGETRFGDYASAPQTTQADYHLGQEPGTRLRQPAYLSDYSPPDADPEPPPDRGRHRAAE
jgi:hypothetical protein